MTDFEREDMELKSIMGDKFQDGTEAPKKTEPKKVSKDIPTIKKAYPGVDDEAVNEIWSPFDAEPSFSQKLTNCAKWASLYSALYLLFYYWQCTGQMQPSASGLSMTVCAVMVGWSFGKFAFRGERK